RRTGLTDHSAGIALFCFTACMVALSLRVRGHSVAIRGDKRSHLSTQPELTLSCGKDRLSLCPGCSLATQQRRLEDHPCASSWGESNVCAQLLPCNLGHRKTCILLRQSV